MASRFVGRLTGPRRAGALVAVVLLGVYAATAAAAQAGFGAPFMLGSGVGPLAVAASPDGTVWAAAAGPAGPPAERSQVSLWIRRPDGRLLGPRAFRVAPGYQVDDVRVAAGSGWAVVAWDAVELNASGLPRPGSQDELRAVRCTPTGCGPVRTVVSVAPPGSVGSLKVAAVGRRALLLWIGTNGRDVITHGVDYGPTPQVDWALSDSRGRYGRPRTLGTSVAAYSVLALAATAHSRAVVAWVYNSAGPGVQPVERVQIAEFAGHGFGRVRVAPGPAGVDPQLAAAGGEVLLAWRGGFADTDGGGDAGSVYVAVQAAGQSTFSPAQTVASCSCDQLRLAISSTGRAILAFDNGEPDSPELMVSLREPRGTFTTPAASPAADSSDAVLSVDAAGTATLAWTGAHGGGPPDTAQATLYAAQAPLSQPFGSPVAVASASTPDPGFTPACGNPPCPSFVLRINLSQPNLLALGNETLLTWSLPPTSADQIPSGHHWIPSYYQGAIGA